MKYCVYGAARDSIADKYKNAVTELSYELAKLGHTLVFGAGSTGVMGAAARGATKGNGDIIGVTPFFMYEYEPIYDKCNILINTDTMAERKSKIEDLSDCFVICPGGIGTFDEFFQIITLKQLERVDKKIALFNVDGFFDGLLTYLKQCVDLNFIDARVMDMCKVCNTKEDIIVYITND